MTLPFSKNIFLIKKNSYFTCAGSGVTILYLLGFLELSEKLGFMSYVTASSPGFLINPDSDPGSGHGSRFYG
jgi:hypothetical protein